MRKGTKRLISFVMAGVMTVSGVVLNGGGSRKRSVVDAAAAPDVSSAINYSTILGRAVDYGIVAKEFYQNMHMETTLATTDFWNLSGSSCDPDMAGIQPVHYIIGAVNQGALYFNATAENGPMIANVETTAEVIANSNINDKTGIYADTGFTNNGGVIQFKTQTKAAISSNIDNIVEHGVDESDAIVSKIATKGVNVETVRDTSSSKYVIDLTDDSYIGKVVYLNVASDNTDFLKAIAGTGDFEIKKHSDTVVVFNVNATTNTDLEGVPRAGLPEKTIDGEDAEQLKFGKHNIYVVEKGIDNAIDTQTQWNGNVEQHDIDVDNEVAQKIIWNLPKASRVSLNTSAGLFLASKENVLVTLDNQAAGWIIANGKVKNNAEFHYVYQGRNASANSDNESLFHFSLKKAFTHSYTTVKKDTTYDLDANQYSFALYESVDGFDTLGSKVGNTVSNMDTNKVKLPDINIDSEGTYYYVIKEEAGTNVPDGVTVSDGEIDIKVVVTKENVNGADVLYAKVYSDYYLTSADKTAGKVYKTNNGIDVSGFEFSLGDFFNLLSSSLVVEKKVTGAYTPSATETFKITLKDADNKYYDINGNVVTGDNTKVNVPVNGKVSFKNLPAGTYTVEEVADGSSNRTGYALTTTYTGNSASVDGETTPTITVTNNYEETGKLTVTKKVIGDNTAAASEPVQFNIRRTSDNKYVKKDSNSGVISYVTKSEATDFSVTPGTPFNISKLTSDTYVVEEIPPTYDTTLYTLNTTYDPENGVAVDDTSTTAASIEITNKYTAPKGTIVVNKHITIDGKEITYYSADPYVSPGDITNWGSYTAGLAFGITDGGTYSTEFSFNGMTAGTNEGTKSKTTEVLLGEYTVSEKACPDIVLSNGKTYSATTTIDGVETTSKTIDVDTDGQTYTVNIVNAYTEKTDDTVTLTVEKNINISGNDDKEFSFKVRQKSGGNNADKYVHVEDDVVTYVDAVDATTFTVSKNTHKVISGLEKAIYTVEEDTTTATIAGYTLDSTTATVSPSETSVEANLSAGNNTAILVNNYTEITTDVVISKVKSGAGGELSGAILTLTSLDGKTIDINKVVLGQDNGVNGENATTTQTTNGTSFTWTSGTAPTTIGGLSNGAYKLHEDTAPLGYDKATDITFYVKDGKVYSDSEYINEIDSNTVVMTDALEEVGSLSVSKSVADVDNDETTFPITITLTHESKKVNRAYNVSGWTAQTLTFLTENGEPETTASVTVYISEASGPLVISGIPVGTTYSVTEGDISDNTYTGYAADSLTPITYGNTNTTRSITKGVTDTVTVNNTYTAPAPETASLTINKTFANGSAITAADITTTGKLTFTVASTSLNPAYSQTFDYTSFTNGSKTISDLKPDTYTVTETSTVEGSNYTRTTTVAVGTGEAANANNASVELTAGDAKTVTFTNNYERKTGSLVLKKAFDTTVTDYPTNYEGESFKVVVTLTDENNAALSGNATYGGISFTNGVSGEITISKNSSVTISGIPYGYHYSVVESAPTAAGYSIKTGTDSGTISASTQDATVTNTYTYTAPISVKLTATKNYVDANNNPLTLSGIQFTFTLSGPKIDTIQSKSNDADGDIVFDDIIFTSDDIRNDPYVYTISEVPPSGVTVGNNTLNGMTYDMTIYKAYVVISKDNSGALKAAVTYKKVTGTAPETLEDVQSITFTNKFTAPKGKIVVTKVDSADNTIKLSGASFKLYGSETGDDQVGDEKTTGEDGTVTFENLETEKTYYLLETKAPNENYEAPSTTRIAVKVTGTVGTDNVVTVNQTVKNTKKDTPQPTTGKLTLTKTFGGDITEEEVLHGSISFIVKCGDKYLDKDGNLVDTETEINITDLTTHENGTLKWSKTFDVPFGEYTVTEKNTTMYIKDGNYKVPFTFVSEQSKTTATGTVSATADKTLELVNYYSKPVVKISKIDATGKQEIDGAELELYSSDDKGNKVGDFSKTWISSSKEVMKFVLPAGTYTIKETVAPKGYEVQTNLFIFKVEYDKDDNLILTQISDDHLPGTYDSKSGLISFENDPIKVTGKLSVHVVEEKTGDDVPNAVVRITGPDGFDETYTTNDKGEIVDKDGKTPIEVPAGTYKVTIVEVTEGYEVTTGEVGEVVVPENGEARHEAKIIPKEEGTTTETTTQTTETTEGTKETTTETTTETDDLGNLIITVTEVETGREVPGATVEVVYPDGTVKTYTTDEKGQITIKDIPVGDYSITVKKVPEGYSVTTGEAAICTVTAGATAEHEAKIVTKTNTDTTDKVVKTDDPTETTPFVIMMLISCAGIVFFGTRKRKLNK